MCSITMGLTMKKKEKNNSGISCAKFQINIVNIYATRSYSFNLFAFSVRTHILSTDITRWWVFFIMASDVTLVDLVLLNNFSNAEYFVFFFFFHKLIERLYSRILGNMRCVFMNARLHFTLTHSFVWFVGVLLLFF